MNFRLPFCSVGLRYGIFSHFAAAFFPFVAGALLSQLGVFSASSLFYVMGVGILLCVVLVSSKLRLEVASILILLVRGEWPWRFSVALLCFAIAGAGYYLGLEKAAVKLEYIYLTRLDFVLQIPVGILVLRERPNLWGLCGAAIAAIGGAIIAYKGAFGPSGLEWAFLYVVASIGAYTLITPVLKERPSYTPFAVVAMRTLLLTAVFAAMVPLHEQWRTPENWTTWLTVLCAAALLIGMFLLRFAALRRIQLWVFSALAPLQAFGATLIAASLGNLPGWISAFGIFLIVSGELLVSLGERGVRAGEV